MARHVRREPFAHGRVRPREHRRLQCTMRSFCPSRRSYILIETRVSIHRINRGLSSVKGRLLPKGEFLCWCFCLDRVLLFAPPRPSSRFLSLDVAPIKRNLRTRDQRAPYPHRRPLSLPQHRQAQAAGPRLRHRPRPPAIHREIRHRAGPAPTNRLPAAIANTSACFRFATMEALTAKTAFLPVLPARSAFGPALYFGRAVSRRAI